MTFGRAFREDRFGAFPKSGYIVPYGARSLSSAGPRHNNDENEQQPGPLAVSCLPGHLISSHSVANIRMKDGLWPPTKVQSRFVPNPSPRRNIEC